MKKLTEAQISVIDAKRINIKILMSMKPTIKSLYPHSVILDHPSTPVIKYDHENWREYGR